MANDERRPVLCDEWAEALDRASLPSAQLEAFRREIFMFLRHCRTVHSPATVALAKQYLEGRRTEVARAALRWFVTHGRILPSQPADVSGKTSEIPRDS